MHILILILVLLALIAGPGLWVKRIMQRYSEPADRYPFSGGELARKLLDSLQLQDVGTEITDAGDHYDPMNKIVRLTQQHYDGRSLTAITIAAHEVGHAIQDASGYRPLRLRTQLVRWVSPVEKTGAALLMASPLIIALTRLPAVGLVTILGGLLTLGSGALIHVLTLPTEFDASFARALPLLTQQNILMPVDEPHSRRLLKAAALTYVSAALTSLLNIARWWAILRR